MKKLLVVAALVGAGVLVWRAISQQDEARDLWAEVTDKL
ncbi:DLW-39 family protein [Rarobacter faecitabidus]|uniref:Uncharacterized protein n=1 Tax=Rarobacter faecitabidus TaxID=13243 RepID=A0A542ZPQ9_RARFA|nr:DLW-39 family protein [Rarobacter faecitabidus]TQL62200.1 hypothetical protein FB461_1840 [Rarobacter faecitabidus]